MLANEIKHLDIKYVAQFKSCWPVLEVKRHRGDERPGLEVRRMVRDTVWNAPRTYRRHG